MKTLWQAILILNVSLTVALAANTFGLDRTALLEPPAVGAQLMLPSLTVREAADHLIKQDATFVDARSFQTYQGGFIPGALSIEVGGTIPTSSIEPLLNAKLVIVYCDGPDCHASDKVAQTLMLHGIENVAIMRQGWQGWIAAGMPSQKIRGPLPSKELP